MSEPAPSTGDIPEDLFERLVGSVSAVTYVMRFGHADEPPLYVSPQAEAVVGLPPDALMVDARGRNELLHPDDRERIWQLATHLETTGGDWDEEYRLIQPDGTFRWVHDQARVVPEAPGHPALWFGVLTDLTRTHDAERALADSEARFRALIEQSPAVVYEMSLDDERQTLYVNPQVEALFGYSAKEWLDQPDIWMELLHPEDRELELAANDLHNHTGDPWSQEYRLIANDGRVVWVHDQAVLVTDHTGQPPKWQGIMLDITPQKELEERLRKMNDELELRVSERTAELAEANEMMALEIGVRQRTETELHDASERYRKLVEDVPAVVYIWHVGPPASTDPRSYTSPRAEHMLGYTQQEWERTTLWEERVHPHDRERVISAARHSEATGEPFEQEYRCLAKDGHLVWVLDHATLLTRDRHGEPELFQGVLLDITSRKAAEQKARESEEHFRMLVETGPAASYLYELERQEPGTVVRLIYASPKVSELLGRSIDERFESPEQLLSFVHPDDREQLWAELAEQWRTGADFDRELRVIASDGRVIWVHNQGRCIARDEHGRPSRFHSVLLDVTRHMEEQMQLRQSEAELRSLVEGLPGFPWIEIVERGAGQGRLVYIGERVEQMLGYPAEELLAEPGHLERMVHPDDRARMMALSAHHDKTEDPWRAQYRSQTRDGRIRWLWSEAEASRDEQGRLVWTGMTFDVTAMHTADDLTTVPHVMGVEH